MVYVIKNSKSSSITLVLFMSEFSFVIKHRPGSLNVKADALSRPAENTSKTTASRPVLNSSIFLNSVQIVNRDNVRELIAVYGLEKYNASDFSTDNSKLVYRQREFVLDHNQHLEILKNGHDSLLSGHIGISKTKELVSRDFWSPGMLAMIRDYVLSCDVCARAKDSRHKLYGSFYGKTFQTQSLA